MYTANPFPVLNDYRDLPVYKFSQGNPCNDYRIPATRTGVPCNENRFFPVRISTQGKPCSGPVQDCSVVNAKGILFKGGNYSRKLNLNFS